MILQEQTRLPIKWIVFPVMVILIASITGMMVVLHDQNLNAISSQLSISESIDGTQSNTAYAQTNGIKDNQNALSSTPLSLIELFEKTESGVVSISIQKDSSLMINGEPIPFNNNAVGSGFVYDNHGHIITNNHVVRDAQKIVVTFTNGYSYNA